MKFLNRFAFFFIIASFGACSSNNAAKGDNSNAAVASPDASKTSSSSSSGDASFSCKIDGKDFSGKGTDQILNAASVHAPGIIYFNLSPTYTGDLSSDLRQGGFGFEVPDHGTITIRNVENSDYSIAFNPPNDPKNGYTCKEMVITINSSATRVTGTFGGTFIDPKTHKDVAVTDGKFDIPYSSLSKK
jgi:hypothetical protein